MDFSPLEMNWQHFRVGTRVNDYSKRKARWFFREPGETVLAIRENHANDQKVCGFFRIRSPTVRDGCS
jgi:hypothetical protein